MKNSFAITFSIGLAVIAVAVAGIMYMQRGAHMDLLGKILKVRTVATDEENSVAVVDFQVTNPSDYPFMVREVSLILESPDGSQSPGIVSSEVDAQRFFEGMPVLGPKAGKSLIGRESVPARSTTAHIVLAQFRAPESKLQERKRFLVRIEEIDGKVYEFSEK